MRTGGGTHVPHQQAAVQFCLKHGLLAVLSVGFGPTEFGPRLNARIILNHVYFYFFLYIM